MSRAQRNGRPRSRLARPRKRITLVIEVIHPTKSTVRRSTHASARARLRVGEDYRGDGHRCSGTMDRRISDTTHALAVIRPYPSRASRASLVVPRRHVVTSRGRRACRTRRGDAWGSRESLGGLRSEDWSPGTSYSRRGLENRCQRRPAVKLPGQHGGPLHAPGVWASTITRDLGSRVRPSPSVRESQGASSRRQMAPPGSGELTAVTIATAVFLDVRRHQDRHRRGSGRPTGAHECAQSTWLA